MDLGTCGENDFGGGMKNKYPPSEKLLRLLEWKRSLSQEFKDVNLLWAAERARIIALNKAARAKVAQDRVKQISKLIAKGHSQKEIAAKMGLCYGTINRICRYVKSDLSSPSQTPNSSPPF